LLKLNPTYIMRAMLKTISLLLHLIRIIIILIKPEGTKALIAENMMLRKQLIKQSRNQKRCANLSFWDRLFFAIAAHFINPSRLFKSAILIKPATIIKFHKALIKRKYRWLFSAKSMKKPGPKGPSRELIDLILEMKKRNPQYGCLRIAMQIKNAFGIEIHKDIVRRVLKNHLKNYPGNNNGPSWLAFLANMKDSLWSIDFFRCESIALKFYWVMVVMDQFSRKIIGFAVHRGNLSGNAICCMLNKITSKQPLPKHLSSDNDHYSNIIDGKQTYEY
jgi:putative transposase